MAPKGADGRRPARGGATAAREAIKRGAEVASSPHVETLVEERAVGKAATTKIDASGRNSKTAAASSVGGVRDPADLNRCTSKPPMQRSGEVELGSVTDGEEARASAMARWSALQAVASACEGKGRRGSLGVCEGGCGGALGALI
jgi:hypothetical protein